MRTPDKSAKKYLEEQAAETPENLPSSVWAIAWCKLYGVFSERLDQENIDLMDSILAAVESDMQDEIKRLRGEEEGNGT